MPGDEELGDRHQGVEERTHAQDDQQDLDDLPGEIRRRRIRPHRRHRVEGEEEPLPNRDVLGQRVGDRARGHDPDDEDDQRRQAAQERLELAASARAVEAPEAAQAVLLLRQRPRPRRSRCTPPQGHRPRRPPSRRRRGSPRRPPRRRRSPGRCRRRPRSSPAPTTAPSRSTLSGESAMKGWPPQPGLTVMQRKMSASFTDSLTAATGVPGLIASPARQPSSRIAFSVRLTCGVASSWKVIESAPALANSSMWRVRALDHQVDVDGAARVVDLVGDRARDQRPDRDRRDEVAVHHVDVDHPRAGGHHLLDLRAEPREVGREDRRARPALAKRSRRLVEAVSVAASKVRSS